MSQNELLETTRELIATEMNLLAANLAAGHAQDYAQYREVVGTISGLRASLDFMQTAYNQLYNPEALKDQA